MEGEQTRKSRIQIPLPSKPRPYRPGDGPPLAPLRVRPEYGSTAFLIDKRVLPGTARNGELQLQMYYVVGWWDVPAARVAILATKILEYVSPGVLEDFEYRALLERDAEMEIEEERKKEKAEIAKKRKVVKSTDATDTPTTPGTPTAPGQRRRGRPSKAELQARKLSKQSSVNNSESVEVALPPTSTSGPSLSTPQKKRATEIVTDMEEVDAADPDDAIHRQLCGDNSDAVEEMDVDEDKDEDEDGDDDEGDDDEGDISLDRVPGATSSGLEISSYARKLWLNQDSTLFKSANGSLALKSSTTSYVPVPEVLRSNKQPWELPAQTPLPPPIPKPRPPQPPKPINEQLRKPPISRVQSTTPVPVPTPVKSDKKIPLQYPQLLQRPHPSTLKPKPSSFENKQSTTPVPVFQHPLLKSGKCAATPSAPPSQTPKPKTSPQHHGFTPAGRSSGHWPSETPKASIEAAADSPLNRPAVHSSLPKKRTHAPKPKPAATTNQGRVWVVLRLEGDKLVHAHGRRTRYFKVRWAGDWPPDQNPTWEPEDNIAPGLVQRYLKSKPKAAARRRTTGSPTKNGVNSPLRAHPLALKRKYSSVAEAFAGDADDLDELRNSAESGGEANGGAAVKGKSRRSAGYAYYEDEEGEDEILVVTTEQESGLKRRDPRPKKKADELGVAFMRDLAAAIQNGGSGS
ncbi:hypothetical protein F4781DRAFT_360685 [Annulohypoxylon bovei var. microspora]|nr:hypothetical protein F4781DRAFT_360685 [Annulohypoxylon bovei var. microspora]